jgi:hypothetical protein
MLQEDICSGSYNCLFNIEFSIHLINLLLNKIWCLSTPPIAMGSFHNKILISKLYLYLLEKEDASGLTFRKTTLTTRGNTEGFWGFSNAFPENTRFVLKGAAILDGAMKKDQMQE